MPRIDDVIRREMIEEVMDGKSFREVGRKYGFSQTAVHKLCNKYEKTNGIENLQKSGRLKKTSKKEDRKLVQMYRANCKWTSKKLLHNWNINKSVSVSTVKRILHKAKIFGRISAKKPWLSK